MSVHLKDDGRGDAAAIHHDGKVTERLQPLAADDGDGLSGLHLVTNMYEVLGVVAVDGLEAVVVADDDDVTEGGIVL